MRSPLLLALSAFVVLPTFASADVPKPSDPGLLGTTVASTWLDFKSSNYSSFPVNSVENNARLSKVSGGSFFASSSLYGGFAGAPSVYDLAPNTALSGLNTVVFQVRVGKGESTDFSNAPVLSYTTAAGGSGTLTTTQQVLAQETATGGPFGSITTSLYKYQWDLSDIADVSSITSFKVSYGLVLHSTLTNIRLDQSTFDYSQPVPEPTTIAALSLGAFAAIRRRKKA